MRNRKNRDRNITHFIYVLPNLLMYSLLSIVPIVLGLYYSFTDWNGIGKNYDFVGFHNYIKIFLGCLGLQLFNIPLFFKINKMQKIF